MAEEQTAPKPMSWSTSNSILTCGWQYYLERVLHFDSRPQWATIGGGAFHRVVEEELHRRYEEQKHG